MRKRIRGRIPFLRIVAVLFVIAVFAICDRRLEPYIHSRAEYGAKSNVSGIIASAAGAVFSTCNKSYSDYATVIYDENGKVCSIEILSLEVSKMQSLLSERIYDELKKIEDTEINVSIGDISGFFPLFNRGLDIKVRIDSVGSVVCNVESEFTQSGVNQTCHSIYFDIIADITVIFPFECIKTCVNVKYLAAQTVIVGEVPQLYAEK